MIKNEDTGFYGLYKVPVVVNDFKRFTECISCDDDAGDQYIKQANQCYYSENNTGKTNPRGVDNAADTFKDSKINVIVISDCEKSNEEDDAVQSKPDKTYTRAIKLIDRYCQLLELPQLQKPAEAYFFEVKDHTAVKGKRIDVLVAAIICVAGKKSKVKLKLKMQSLAFLTKIAYKTIIKAYLLIMNLIPKIINSSDDYVELLGSRLKLPRDTVMELEKICKVVETKDTFCKKQPQSRTIAAAVLYFYSHIKPELNLTLSQIKEASEVSSENTIKKYFSLLMSNREAILKSSLKEETNYFSLT